MTKIRIEIKKWLNLKDHHAFAQVIEALYDLKKEGGYEIVLIIENQEKNINEIIDEYHRKINT